ncbi:MAG: hypothetical protein GQ531_06660 [Sulfurovum sp.]|nr:hypothetical protein [Sulfurovum sp.]
MIANKTNGSTIMKKLFVLSLIVGFGLMASGCEEKKTTEEQLKENVEQTAELLKKSLSEKTEKLNEALEKEAEALEK